MHLGAPCVKRLLPLLPLLDRVYCVIGSMYVRVYVGVYVRVYVRCSMYVRVYVRCIVCVYVRVCVCTGNILTSTFSSDVICHQNALLRHRAVDGDFFRHTRKHDI